MRDGCASVCCNICLMQDFCSRRAHVFMWQSLYEMLCVCMTLAMRVHEWHLLHVGLTPCDTGMSEHAIVCDNPCRSLACDNV